MLAVKNETSKSAELYIYGTIIDDEEATWARYLEKDITGYEFPTELREQLDGLKGKDLTLYINSYGGSIPAGVAMANMIKRHNAKTTAIVDGYCCSIATQIFFSADECKMPANSWLMIHKPWSYAEGDANFMRKTAEVLDILQSGLEDTYLSKVKDHMSNNDVHNMVEQETWLTGTEAAEKFKIEVIDAVKTQNCVGNKEKLKAIAKKIPPSLNFVAEEKFTPPKPNDWSEVEIALARAKGVAWI